MVPFDILLSHLDVVKDVVLVIRLLLSIGWFLDPTQFSSMVILLTVLSKTVWPIYIKLILFLGYHFIVTYHPSSPDIG